MGRFKYAYNSFSYYGEEIGRSVERVAAFGYDAIELVGEPEQHDGSRIRKLAADAGPGWTANCEDTLAIGDADLRATIESRHPELWSRITTRRAFMRNSLGIDVRDEVLPLTPTPGYFPPFWLNLERAVVYA